MKISRILMILILIAGAAFLFSHQASGQSSDSVFIPETGHWIWGDFLRLYNSVSDPLLFFGYPLTDDFTDPLTNQRVQYFQKVRMDLVDTSAGPQVVIFPLGQYFYEPGSPLADVPNQGPTCRAFPSGFPVCYAFLQFYDAYNGAAWFGNPISEVEVIDGRYMQYFEKARLEWWPENPAGSRVILSELGSIYFTKIVANPELLNPNPPTNIAAKAVNPQVRVFALNALIGAGETQTIYVIVQDQFLRPLESAQVGVTLHFPDGSDEFYRLPETNKFGISQTSFETGDYLVQKVVNVTAEVTLRGETALGRTWFRIWW